MQLEEHNSIHLHMSIQWPLTVRRVSRRDPCSGTRFWILWRTLPECSGPMAWASAALSISKASYLHACVTWKEKRKQQIRLRIKLNQIKWYTYISGSPFSRFDVMLHGICRTTLGWSAFSFSIHSSSPDQMTSRGLVGITLCFRARAGVAGDWLADTAGICKGSVGGGKKMRYVFEVAII